MSRGRSASPAQLPLRVGLTGNIGSGKSSVARLLRHHGAAVIDSDVVARQATEDRTVLDRIAKDLGPELVTWSEDGVPHLDRARTAALVFGDADALATLNGIIHPWVRSRSAELERELIDSQDPPPVIVLDIPLLYENGLEVGLDAVVVVTAPLETRLARVVDRAGAANETERAAALADAEARDATQMPLAEKAARAEFVVDNSGSAGDLEENTARLWADLLALSRAAR
ncbi:MAG TPA: dephospho-CoA kinase [Trueperaceae bacterium]|nr:dephospho-CoA kinase [Trueperaceae bacterium]